MANVFHPWEGYTKPFKIFGNIYFVGTEPASTHLIDTGDGLIVIDPGYPQSLYLVINNICELGFKIRDIKYIVLTHGHYDHLGAARALVELTGAKTFIGKEDIGAANGTRDTAHADVVGTEYYEAFEPDVLISDGDVIELGNTKILFRDAPGHTPGTKALFFDVTDGKQTLRAAMHGGVGLKAMTKESLEKDGFPIELREKFVPAIEGFIDEPVDILLGNHVWNNDTIGKGAQITDDFNPFIDGTAWKKFLTKRIEMYYEMINKD